MACRHDYGWLAWATEHPRHLPRQCGGVYRAPLLLFCGNHSSTGIQLKYSALLTGIAVIILMFYAASFVVSRGPIFSLVIPED
jgi:hypothetical protein